MSTRGLLAGGMSIVKEQKGRAQIRMQHRRHALASTLTPPQLCLVLQRGLHSQVTMDTWQALVFGCCGQT